MSQNQRKDGAIWYSPAVEITKLKNEVAALRTENERLREAVEAVLRTWKKAGPNGSHQFEKFDHCIRLCEMAVERTPA